MQMVGQGCKRWVILCLRRGRIAEGGTCCGKVGAKCVGKIGHDVQKVGWGYRRRGMHIN